MIKTNIPTRKSFFGYVLVFGNDKAVIVVIVILSFKRQTTKIKLFQLWYSVVTKNIYFVYFMKVRFVFWSIH